MRIAFVTETWLPSIDGVVTRLVATIGHLHRMGHETLVIAPAVRGVDAWPPGTVTVPAVGLPFIAGGKPWGLPLAGRMGQAVEHFDPDLVHVVNPFVLGSAGVSVARRRHLPLVASFHQDIAAVSEHYHLGFLRPVIWAHVRRLHQCADLNLATSEATASEIAAHGIDKVALWPYGVDTDRFRPRRRATRRRGSPGEVTALYAGRLAPEKDLERLAPLAGAPGIHLVVAGDGPLRPRLEQRLAGGNVEFRGWLDSAALADAYAEADVFVFPSTTETLGLVLLEALASGLPVVAADSATTSEIVGQSPCGELLAEAGWNQLASVVHDVGTRDATWERRSLAGRDRARAWSWAAATENLVIHYRNVLAGCSGAGEMIEDPEAVG